MPSRVKEKDAKAKAKLAEMAPDHARAGAQHQGLSQEDQDAAVAAAAKLNPSPPA